MSNRFRSFVLITFVLLTALSLPPRVRGATYSDVFPAALSNYAYGGWQGPFGDGTAGRLFPTSDGTGIYADATYNGLVWALRSSPEFASIDMTMHFSIPNRDFTTADYFALLLILHSPTTPPSTLPGTNCDGTCSYVAGQSGFKILYRIGFNQLVITNGPGNVTLSQVSLPPVALDQPHDARATYAAGNLTVYLDSVQLATLQIPNLPAGQIGFETYRTDLIVNTITLIGSPVPGFALSVSPASATIAPGSSTSTTIIVASFSGFSGTVTLSATTSTSGLTVSLNPSSLVLAAGSNLTSTLTVNTGSFCGNETVTVMGTSSSDTRSVTFTVTTQGQGQCTFDFSLATSPATLTIVAGEFTGFEFASATLVAGVSTAVMFSIATVLPSGVTAQAFNPASCSPSCSASLGLTASATAPSTTSTLTIQAAGGGIIRTTTFTLVVAPPRPFDFSLAATPTTLTIVQGTAGAVETATATLVSGVTTAVTFSITTVLPTGVTASAFTPASCSPSCSAILTLTASATAPSSTTTLTIQAVGGGVIRTATFSLVVVPPGTFDFSLAVTPSTLSIIHGEASGLEIASTTLMAGATTPVTFSIATTLPTGVTAYPFAPSSCSPSCSTSVTLTASATAPPSTTFITIQATGGGVTRTATFNLVVTCNTGGSIDFCLSASPSTLTIVPGGPSGVETVSATLLAGTTTPVTFHNLTVLPTGVTASAFTPASCPPTCSATWTFTASPNAPASTRIVYISATGGGVTSPANFTLIVQQCACQLNLTPSPSTLTIVPGGAGQTETVTATLVAGVAPPVTFSIITPLPIGVGASAFTPLSCIPTCSATVVLTASPTAPGSNMTLMIQATGGGITRTTTFNLVITCGAGGPFDLCLTTTPSNLTIFPSGPGGVETVTATLLAGSPTPITFSIPNTLPLGVTASAFTPASCSPTCSATVTLTASATAPSSTTTVTIQAVGGGITRTTTFNLVICACFVLTLAVSPATLSITDGAAGGVETATATLSSGTTTPFTFSILTALPSGVTASAFTNSPCSPTCSATVTLTASATAPASTTLITIQASGGSPTVTHTATFTLVVSGLFDFTLAASPSTLTITPGATGGVETATATLATGATTTPVTFTILTTLTSGVTASAFTNNPCSPACSATVTFTAAATAPASSTVITIQATGGSPAVTHTTTFILVISGFFDFTLAASPATLTVTDGGAGGVETVIATLVTGTTPPFTFSFATALPIGVTASAFTPPSCSPTCSATVTLTASSTAPSSSTVLTIQAVGGGATRGTTFTLVVTGGVRDADGDGIFNSVDIQPTVFSKDFSDIPLGGATYGTVLSRGDQCPTLPCQLTIQEASPTAGILITAGPNGGLTPASISVCGGASILSVSAGDQLAVRCGSVTVTVITGAVLVTFVGAGPNSGIDGTATIVAGNGLTFQPATFGFAAPTTNIAIVNVIINGNSLPIAPGQITSSPFAVFTISEVNPMGQVFSAGVVLKFDGSASFATVGPITRYTWNFGDGTILSNAASKVTHTYAVNGTYTVSLIVADNFGTSDSQSNTLNVLPAPIAGSETFSHNLFVSGDRLVQTVTVQITNPNSYPILVNVLIAGNCDTACPFSDQSGPILLAAGQTKFISVVHTFNPLDQGQTFVMQVTVTFSTKTSNTDVGTYIPASSRTFLFTIK